MGIRGVPAAQPQTRGGGPRRPSQNACRWQL